MNAETELSFSATVTDIKLESRVGTAGVWWMALDHTQFTTGSNGVLEAWTRSGTQLELAVTDVVEDGGVLWHVVEKPLAAGTEVRGRVHPPGQ